jgi:preprotein translocase subunit YajC
MLPTVIHAFLALGPAPGPPGTQQNPTAQLVQTVGMFVLMGVVFYFLLIRPQRTRAKQQEDLLKALKSGDKIVTASGIIGVVISVKDKSVSIRSSDAKLEILKSAISEITERAGEASQST